MKYCDYRCFDLCMRLCDYIVGFPATCLDVDGNTVINSAMEESYVHVFGIMNLTFKSWMSRLTHLQLNVSNSLLFWDGDRGFQRNDKVCSARVLSEIASNMIDQPRDSKL